MLYTTTSKWAIMVAIVGALSNAANHHQLKDQNGLNKISNNNITNNENTYLPENVIINPTSKYQSLQANESANADRTHKNGSESDDHRHNNTNKLIDDNNADMGMGFDVSQYHDVRLMEPEKGKTRADSQSKSGTSNVPFVGNLGKENIEEESIEFEQREVDDAVKYGLKAMKELLEVKEPFLYKLGLYLDKNDPASRLASFSAPKEETIKLARFGYAALEASRKLSEMFPKTLGRQRTGLPPSLRADVLSSQCPLGGNPRCPPASRRYRTADGTCNNFELPWRGASMLPMQRFLPPSFDDGIQGIRRSVFGGRLPSPRDISVRIHRDRDNEMPTVTLMFMQWGQFVDHDVIQSAQATSFNNSIPRCCGRGGFDFLPPELLHPSCLPIEVSKDDWFFSQFGIRCIEFVRSAPTSRINCDLGWREQINQVTPYIDGSTIYGSDPRTSDSTRLFRSGLMRYGRPRGNRPLQPPDPPGGELCRAGALTTDCFNSGDGRVGEQPGLTAFHTTWLRYHNHLANGLQKLNPHWSDEKIYQETRKIVGALIQHITYREFLPLVVGQEVMDLFDLTLLRKGFYKGYDSRVNPAIANAFGTAAFRFGHSLVQNSYVRFDTQHRPIFNNVTLHREQENIENIWSFGSVDRLLLGFCNQPSQRRDEFIGEELTNHLFQSSNSPFGMDLASTNIQRGRDHGIPAYTAWREPCGLTRILDWKDLERVMPNDAAKRFSTLYAHVDDIDLFSGGLAEYPVRGGIVGPTFACVIAQQFLNLRKGDRFWYENDNFESSFTPAQLQQIRRVTFSQVICQTMDEVETIQPFVFLSPDNFRNVRLPCNSPLLESLDLNAWAETKQNEINSNVFQKRVDFKDEVIVNVDGLKSKTGRASSGRKKNKRTKTTTTNRPYVKATKRPIQASLPIKIHTNMTIMATGLKNKYSTNQDTYILTNVPQRPQYENYNRPTYNNNDDYAQYYQTTRRPFVANQDDRFTTTTTQKPLEVNIKIQYFLPNGQTTSSPTTYNRATTKRRKSTKPTRRPTLIQNDYQTTKNPYAYVQTQRPYNNHRPQPTYDDRPFPTSQRPNPYRPNYYVFSDDYWSTTKRPYNRPQHSNYDGFPNDPPTTTKYPSYLYLNNAQTHARPHKRPQQHGYSYDLDKDDAFEEMYSETIHSEVFADNVPKRPTFSYFEDDDDDNKYIIKDRYDFKSGTHKKLPDRIVSSDDKSYVKISSIEGEALMNRWRQSDQAEFRNGGRLDVGNLKKDNNNNMESLKKDKKDSNVSVDRFKNKRRAKVVNLDNMVTSDDISKNNWIFYNATEEEMPPPFMPDVDLDVSFFSNELPHPINVTVDNDLIDKTATMLTHETDNYNTNEDDTLINVNNQTDNDSSRQL